MLENHQVPRSSAAGLTEVGRTSYNFSDTNLLGFIGTRQPAIWMGDFGQVSIAPRTGGVDVDFKTRGLPFSHDSETAIGKQWKSAAQVREIARRSYSTDKKGFDGNEDCGQMSAWYILSALGFCPLNPATDVYEIGSPLVDKAVLRIGAPYPAAVLTILVKNASPVNKYIQSVTLNGRRFTEPRLRQRDLVAGGTLEYVMGAAPNQQAFAGPH